VCFAYQRQENETKGQLLDGIRQSCLRLVIVVSITERLLLCIVEVLKSE